MLIIESTVRVTLSANGCDVVAGRWVDIYTGQVLSDPSLLDIDHMVPLANGALSYLAPLHVVTSTPYLALGLRMGASSHPSHGRHTSAN